MANGLRFSRPAERQRSRVGWKRLLAVGTNSSFATTLELLNQSPSYIRIFYLCQHPGQIFGKLLCSPYTVSPLFILKLSRFL